MVVARELHYGRAQQIGRDADPVPFKFNLKKIARDFDDYPANLRRARERLVQGRVLLEVGDHLAINKSFDQWATVKGDGTTSPRLSIVQVETARKAALQFDAIHEYNLDQDPQGGSQSTPQGGSQSTPQGGSQSTPQGGSQSTPQGGSQSTPPPIKGVVLETSERLSETHRETAGEPVCVRVEDSISTTDPDPIDYTPPAPSEPVALDPSDPSPAEVIAAFRERLLTERFGIEQTRISPQWFDTALALARHWCVEWVDELLVAEMIKGQPKGLGYYQTTLNRWRSEGGPPSLRKAATLPLTPFSPQPRHDPLKAVIDSFRRDAQ
jgi:hypothetical protein